MQLQHGVVADWAGPKATNKGKVHLVAESMVFPLLSIQILVDIGTTLFRVSATASTVFFGTYE
jgi:hypothetical protein